MEQPCVRLAERLGLDTLGIMLARSQAGWGFLGCERLPVIAEGAPLEALIDLAEARAG
jgi:hypothetical protein